MILTGSFRRQEADVPGSPSLAAVGTAVSRPVKNRAFSYGGCGTLISGLAVCASVAVAVFCFQLTQSGGKLVSCSEVIVASAGRIQAAVTNTQANGELQIPLETGLGGSLGCVSPCYFLSHYSPTTLTPTPSVSGRSPGE